MLGPLVLSTAQRTLSASALGGRRPKQVLEILLVHRGELVPKERIADLLWGEHLPVDPMRTLEAYVSVLRKRLRDAGIDAQGVLPREPYAYRVALDNVDLDLLAFDELVAMTATEDRQAARIQRRTDALALVRGELLADEPYAEWAGALRDMYAERVVQLELDLADDCLAEGMTRTAIEHAERVLERQPTRERAHRVLMAAHYVQGDRDLALLDYQRCRRVLEEELGVSPLAETEQVFRTVLDQHPVDELPPVRRQHPVLDRHPGRPIRPSGTRFAHNGEATIAYQVIGHGPVDVVFAHAWFSHMEIGWEEPRYSDFLRRLADGRRLIIFDRRGMGMSDPAPTTVTLEERVDDVLGVMDDVGSKRAFLFGSCGSGPITMALAATRPERVSGLILFGTFARMLATADYPHGWSRQFFEKYKAGIEQAWLTGRGIRRSVPTAGDDEALMEWLGRLMRLSAPPAAARSILDFGATLDVRPMLRRISAPALVLHRRNDQWVHPDNGRYLAEHIPDGRLVELDGSDHWPWFGDAGSVLGPIEDFVAGIASSRGASEGFSRVEASSS
jgi:pimeloyl-ACP methyl ester carboxylesterase/DNA-binding SARP family transcriptional activator